MRTPDRPAEGRSFAKLARELAAEQETRRPTVSAGKPGEATTTARVVKAAPKRQRSKSSNPYAVARRQAADFRAKHPELAYKGDVRNTAAHYRLAPVSVTS